MYNLKNKFWIAACAASVISCQADDDQTTLDLDSVEFNSGKADDASDVALYQNGNGFSVEAYGDIALDLWGVMEDAGGFSAVEHRGLDYLVGQRMFCANNGQAAACRINSLIASNSSSYLATIHGQRFNSAASELFGALALASGVSPVSVTQTSSARFECAKTSRDVWCGITPMDDVVTPQGSFLDLDVSELPALGDGYVYEGWLITDDGPVTSGRFNIDSGVHTFEISNELANESTLFILTVEPEFGDDPAPSDVHIIGGAFTNGVATLSSAHGSSIGTDFGNANGSFFLQTPSTSMISEDYAQGIWYLDPADGTPSLDLPSLPSGWVYEGWVVADNGPISTGRFVETSGEDSDGAGAAAGPDGTPPFPGQDFINPALDLIGRTVVISVEPEPDDSPAPFALKPLVLPNVVDVGPGVLQGLEMQSAVFSGRAALR